MNACLDHCSSSSVEGRPLSYPHYCRGDLQAAPLAGTAKGLGQGGEVGEDTHPARVFLMGIFSSLLWIEFEMFTLCPDSENLTWAEKSSQK